jgi:hypothetical protein
MASPDPDARWKEYRRIGINLPEDDSAARGGGDPGQAGDQGVLHHRLRSHLKPGSTGQQAVLDLFVSFPPERGLTRKKPEGPPVNFAHFAPDAVLSYAKGLHDPDLVALLAPMSSAGARDEAMKADPTPAGRRSDAALEKALSGLGELRLPGRRGLGGNRPLEGRVQIDDVGTSSSKSGGRQNCAAAAEVSLKIFRVRSSITSASSIS